MNSPLFPWRFTVRYAFWQLLALLLLPAVWAASVDSASARDPLGLNTLPSRVLDAYAGVTYWLFVGIMTACVFVAQAASLSAALRPAPHLGRPFRVWATALVAGLSSVPLIVSAIFLGVAVASLLSVSFEPPRLSRSVERAMPFIVLGIAVFVWAVSTLAAWLLITRRAARTGSYELAMASVCRDILRCVALLGLVLVPLDIRARLIDGYYPMHLTAQPMTILALVTITVAGPMLVLRRMFEMRRAWYAARCDRCAYEMTAGTPDRCPECGLERSARGEELSGRVQQSAP